MDLDARDFPDQKGQLSAGRHSDVKVTKRLHYGKSVWSSTMEEPLGKIPRIETGRAADGDRREMPQIQRRDRLRF